MFNPESAISTWRNQLSASGIISSEILDELESHLRDDMDRRLRSGAGPEQAFREAARRVGSPEILRVEYDKIGNQERKFMKRSLMFIIAFIGVMVGMALVMPAVAQYRHEGVMRNDEPWLFLIGSLITLAGVGAAARGFRKSRA